MKDRVIEGLKTLNRKQHTQFKLRLFSYCHTCAWWQMIRRAISIASWIFMEKSHEKFRTNEPLQKRPEIVQECVAMSNRFLYSCS